MSQVLQRQLTLAVQLRDEATFDNFLSSPANQVLLNSLRGHTGSGGEPLVFLHGPAGSGKSHLLQASCHQAGARALYLPLAEVMDHAPGEVLQGVEALDLVCLDDLQAVLGRRAWELALFDQLVVHLTTPPPPQVVETRLPTAEPAAEPAAPADPQPKDKPQGDRQLPAAELAQLKKKAKRSDQLQQRLNQVVAENRTLKEKIKALEAIDQNIQKKKTEIESPGE